MSCYVKNIIADDDVISDIKALIPEAAVRRRMSRILKMAVTTAVECCGNIDNKFNSSKILHVIVWKSNYWKFYDFNWGTNKKQNC